MKWIKQIFGIKPDEDNVDVQSLEKFSNATKTCLLYTSDAADE